MENPTAIPVKIQMQKIYVKELTFKVPQAPGLFVSPDFKEYINEPVFSIEFHVKHQALTANQYEVTIQGMVCAKTKANTTSFTLDIQQSALFLIEGIDEKQISGFVNQVCIPQLYPYLCKALADASYQAGFPPITLPPLHAGMNATEKAPLTATPAAEEGNFQQKLESILNS